MEAGCIAKLRLVNFKSHSDTTLEFDQITSFIGISNSGKSHIYKALKMVLYHESFPEDWIRYGCQEASVYLELVDGTSVERKRTRTTQEVRITDSKGKVSVFTGKKDATQFVNSVLGFRKLVVNPATPNVAEPLNFMGVGEISPLLTGSQPASVQKRLSSLLGTDSISQALYALGQEEASVTKDLSGVSTSLDTFVEECNSIQKTLDSVNSLVEDVEKVAAFLDDESKNVSKLEDLYNTHKHLTNTITTFKEAKKLESQLKHLKEVFNYIQIVNLRAELTSLQKKASELKKVFGEASNLLVGLQGNFRLLAKLISLLDSDSKPTCPVCGSVLC